jgi:hypothetical protein
MTKSCYQAVLVSEIQKSISNWVHGLLRTVSWTQYLMYWSHPAGRRLLYQWIIPCYSVTPTENNRKGSGHRRMCSQLKMLESEWMVSSVRGGVWSVWALDSFSTGWQRDRIHPLGRVCVRCCYSSSGVVSILFSYTAATAQCECKMRLCVNNEEQITSVPQGGYPAASILAFTIIFSSSILALNVVISVNFGYEIRTVHYLWAYDCS